MTLISALHTLSRSVGCAMLAVRGGRWVAYFVGGEMLLFFIYKIARGDFYYGTRFEGFLAILAAVFDRIVCKTIVDYSGCFHFRHPLEVSQRCCGERERGQFPNKI